MSANSDISVNCAGIMISRQYLVKMLSVPTELTENVSGIFKSRKHLKNGNAMNAKRYCCNQIHFNWCVLLGKEGWQTRKEEISGKNNKYSKREEENGTTKMNRSTTNLMTKQMLKVMQSMKMLKEMTWIVIKMKDIWKKMKWVMIKMKDNIWDKMKWIVSKMKEIWEKMNFLCSKSYCFWLFCAVLAV